MPKTVIQFDHAALKAACRIMAKGDIRYYLNGVYVEASPTETILAATDGHRLLVLRKEVPNDVRQVETLIIPGEVAQRIVAGSLKAIPTISLTHVDEGKWLVPLLKWDGGHLPVRGRHIPQLAPWCPKPRRGGSEYQAPIPSGLRKGRPRHARQHQLRASSIEVRHNGPGGRVFPRPTAAGDFVGVVMPFVPDTHPRTTPPDWVLTEEPEPISARRALLPKPVLKQNSQTAGGPRHDQNPPPPCPSAKRSFPRKSSAPTPCRSGTKICMSNPASTCAPLS